MPDMGAGPRIYKYAPGVATISLTPLSGFTDVIRRVLVDKVSAADTWILSIAGQECARFVVNILGQQQLLSGATGAAPLDIDIFAFMEEYFEDDLTYTVYNGQTATLSSVGGATADITLSYEEFSAAAVAQGQRNSQGAKSWLAPIYFSRAANVTVAGEALFDTQAGLSFVPTIFTSGTLPQGWVIDVLGFFLQGQGRNTYSGTADHQSVTDRLVIVKNGQRLFTRDAAGGIPLVGTASATGSANTVYGADETPYPAFQDVSPYNWRPLNPPLNIKAGDTLNWYLGVTGDVTGGATYAGALQIALCKIRETG